MKSIDAKRKINFIKSLWMETLKLNVYTFEESKLNNLNTYLIELVNITHSIKINKFKTKRTFGLEFFLKEFSSYLNNNFFFVKTYNTEITLLKEIINKIAKSNKDRDITMELNSLVFIATEIKGKQDNNISKIFTELILYIYDKQRLEDSYSLVNSLTMDLIVEIILDGYSVEFLKKEVYKERKFDFEKLEDIHQSLKQQFENKRNLFNNHKKKQTLFIFRINNLKTLFPFTIKEYTFYNPLRSDLNDYKKNINTLFEEEGLMRKEEVDFLLSRKEKLGSYDSREYENIVKYVDAHVRLKIEHCNEYKAEIEARKKLNEIITYLRFQYNIKNLSISESRVSITGKMKRYPMFRNNKINEKYDLTSYRERNILNEKRDELEDEDNIINILMEKSKLERQYIRNSLQSFHHGLDDLSLVNKFHHFWISLEALLINEKVNNIKSEIINRYSKVLTFYYYYYELIGIYDEILKNFYTKRGYEIPTEISEIKGMEDFVDSLDLLVFSKNLNLFIEYLSDEYLLYRIRRYINLNESVYYRRNFNKNLERSYKQKLSKLYSIRNQMFHSAIKDDSMLVFYTDWLQALLYSLFGTVQNNVIEGKREDKISFMNISYSNFEKFIKREKIQMIECYLSKSD